MEEYEIDLRDYLKVLWQKKWLIVGVFAAAVIFAALVSFRLPDEYEARALLRLQPLPVVAGFSLDSPSLEEIAEITRSDELLLQTAQELKTLQPQVTTPPMELERWLKQNLKALIPAKTDLLELRLTGNRGQEWLRESLDRIIALTKARLETDLKAEVESKLTYLSTLMIAVEGQLEGLREQLKTEIFERKRILEQQRAELLQRMDAIRKNPQFLRLAAGEQNATLQGIVLKREFEVLNARARDIETELQKLDSRGRELFPELNGRLDALEDERTNLRTAIEKTRQAFTQSWQPLAVVSAPFVPEQPVGPKRTLNVLIAGFLGLFGGTLLAFFVNYIKQPQQDAQSKQ